MILLILFTLRNLTINVLNRNVSTQKIRISCSGRNSQSFRRREFVQICTSSISSRCEGRARTPFLWHFSPCWNKKSDTDVDRTFSWLLEYVKGLKIYDYRIRKVIYIQTRMKGSNVALLILPQMQSNNVSHTVLTPPSDRGWLGARYRPSCHGFIRDLHLTEPYEIIKLNGTNHVIYISSLMSLCRNIYKSNIVIGTDCQLPDTEYLDWMRTPLSISILGALRKNIVITRYILIAYALNLTRLFTGAHHIFLTLLFNEKASYFFSCKRRLPKDVHHQGS